jgi:trehalose/maltose hydrolase-like predicted phosphorylase
MPSRRLLSPRHSPSLAVVVALCTGALAAFALPTPARATTSSTPSHRPPVTSPATGLRTKLVSASAAPSTWQLTSSNWHAVTAAPPYIGNGLIGTRIPAAGAGFVAKPVATETHAAGVWADVRDIDHDIPQPQGAVNLPGWTTLTFSDGTATYGLERGKVLSYRQTLSLRSGTVTTSVRWQSPSGRRTDLRYDVMLNRARPRTGVVRLQVRPHWTGRARITDVLGQGFGYHPDFISSGMRRGTEDASAADRSARLTVHTKGTGIDIAYAGRLDPPSGASVAASTAPHLTRLRATFPVQAGKTYSTTKVVGFATSQDSAHPTGAAERAAEATSGAGFGGLHRSSQAAWSRLWRSDIVVPGNAQLQRSLRAAQFYLMSSVALPGHPGAGWSLSPVGLSSDGYNNHVFWDAETWMYPSLLALHPDLARSIVDYRHRTMAGARYNARHTGYQGLRFAWESALTGREVTPGWAETGRLEQHITADVALAQWQYYAAGGNRRWLTTRGYPVIRGAAAFWASRATRNADGSYSIKRTQGPDEDHFPVSDSVYTNVAAATTLRLAAKAARLAGDGVPPRWREIARGLVVLAPRKAGGYCCVRPEFRGYKGDEVKQADAVMLTYPWDYRQPRAVDLSDLRYYAERYNPDGPAMTDSINSVVWSQLRPPGCANWTWTQRSLDPFVTPPYDQFTEARSGQGVFTFLTGEGGFLQEFLYGYPGLRWSAKELVLDPTLPPQLAGGVILRGLQWHGRSVTVDMGRRSTAVRLTSGTPMTVSVRGKDHRLAKGSPVRVSTARPDQQRHGDLALCRAVEASSADASYPAVAAIDGEASTGWAPTARHAALTVRLRSTAQPDSATLVWDGKGTTTYRVQLRSQGGWHTVARRVVRGSGTQHVSWPARSASQIRLLVREQNPGLQLADLEVRRPG